MLDRINAGLLPAALVLEAARDLSVGTIGLVLQIEMAAALPDLPVLAGAHARVAAMTVGPENFCAAWAPSPDRKRCVGPTFVFCAARAAGIAPLGFVGSIGAFEDLDRFRAVVAQARRLGSRGVMAVHPNQVAVLNELFAPTMIELGWARRVVHGERDARTAGLCAFRLEGRMIDAPVVHRARNVLDREHHVPASMEPKT